MPCVARVAGDGHQDDLLADPVCKLLGMALYHSSARSRGVPGIPSGSLAMYRANRASFSHPVRSTGLKTPHRGVIGGGLNRRTGLRYAFVKQPSRRGPALRLRGPLMFG